MLYYRISCYVPGAFPHQIEVRRPLCIVMDNSAKHLPCGSSGRGYPESTVFVKQDAALSGKLDSFSAGSSAQLAPS